MTSSLVSPPFSSLQSHAQTPLRLGVMASGSGTNFEAIAQAIEAGHLPATIAVLIYNNPKAGVIERAQRWGVPTVLHNHRNYPSREALDAAIVDTFKQYEVDWIVMAGWMRIATQVLVNAFPERILNIHPSLLPSFKGIRAIEQALAAKVKITGCTVHLVTLEMDSGPILIQAAVPILPDDTATTLHTRIQAQEHAILPQAILLAAQQSEGAEPA